jgi:hypothetical protein
VIQFCHPNSLVVASNRTNPRIATEHGCRLKCQDAARELSTVFLVANGHYYMPCVAKGARPIVPLNSGLGGLHHEQL